MGSYSHLPLDIHVGLPCYPLLARGCRAWGWSGPLLCVGGCVLGFAPLVIVSLRVSGFLRGCIVSREAHRHSLQGWACTTTLRPQNLGMTSPVGTRWLGSCLGIGGVMGRGVLLSLAACSCYPCGASLLSPPCSRLPSLGVFSFSSRSGWWKPVYQRKTQASSPSVLQLFLLNVFAVIPPAP